MGFITAAVLFVLLRKEISVCYEWFPYEQSKAFQTKQGSVIRIYLTTMAQLDTLAIVLVIITFFLILKKLRSQIFPQLSDSTIQQRQEKQLTRLTYGIRSISLFLTIHLSSTFSFPKIFLQAKKCRGNAYFFIHLRSCESHK